MFGSNKPVVLDRYGHRRSRLRIPRWLVLLLLGIATGAGGLIYLQENHLPKRLSASASVELQQAYTQADAERTQLKADLAATTKKLETALAEAKTNATELAASRQTVDRLRIMTLDYSDPEAGPVADPGWTMDSYRFVRGFAGPTVALDIAYPLYGIDTGPKGGRLVSFVEAQGLAARPGPRQRIDRHVAQAIAEAIKSCRILEVSYRARDEVQARPRRLAPYGLLTGIRRYLVARPEEEPDAAPRLYVVESIRGARVTDEAFTRDPAFNLQAFARRSFGVFQNPEEYGEVVWRFSPRAAAHARGFEFHASQTMEDQPDGSLIVRFWASGQLEMAWHLYMWGDDVEVLAPPSLSEMVHNFRRRDFPSLP